MKKDDDNDDDDDEDEDEKVKRRKKNKEWRERRSSSNSQVSLCLGCKYTFKATNTDFSTLAAPFHLANKY